MVRFLKYSLSLVLIFSWACQKDQPLPSNAAPELQTTIDSIYKETRHYMRGSQSRQKLFDTLISLDPSNARYYHEKATAHVFSGHFDLAYPLMEKAMELDSSDVGYYYGGFLLYHFRDYPRALQRLEEFDRLTPQSVDYPMGENIHYLKGLALRLMNRYNDAIQEFDKALESDPSSSASSLYLMYKSICLQKQGKWSTSLSVINQMDPEFAQNGMALFYKALALKNTGKLSESKTAFASSLKQIRRGNVPSYPMRDVFDAVYEGMVKAEDRY